MKGPKPNSNIVNLLNGAGHKPINQNEPEYTQLQPLHPPDYLDGVALAKWNELAPKMQEAGVLKDVDTDALAGYCVNHGYFVEAHKRLKSTGLTFELDTGHELRHPLYDVVDKSLRQMRAFSVLLGLDPCSRTRLVAPQKRKGGEFQDI